MNRRNLLLVEDEPNKERHLLNFLFESLPEFDVRVARSYQSALVALDERPVELVLLDMTIPTFDRAPGETGGRPRTFGGREVLAELEARESAPYCIVVTQYQEFSDSEESKSFAELEQELQTAFPKSFRGAVYFDAAESGWAHKLQRRVQRLRDR